MFIVQPGETFWGRTIFRNYLQVPINVAEPKMEIFYYVEVDPNAAPQKVNILDPTNMMRIDKGIYTAKFRIPSDIQTDRTYYVRYTGLDCCEQPPLLREMSEIFRVGTFCDLQPDPCLQETICEPCTIYSPFFFTVAIGPGVDCGDCTQLENTLQCPETELDCNG